MPIDNRDIPTFITITTPYLEDYPVGTNIGWVGTGAKKINPDRWLVSPEERGQTYTATHEDVAREIAHRGGGHYSIYM